MAKGKNSGPFLRGKRGIYYCWVEGRLRSLRTRKPKLAEGKYRDLLSGLERERREAREAAAPRPLTVRECFDLYLEHAKGFSASTLLNRTIDLNGFAAGVGHLPAVELTHEHVEAWLAGHPDWASSTRRLRITEVCAALNFCVRRRKIPANPLSGIAKPRWERRKASLSDRDDGKLHRESSGPFLAILTALRETGARPSELCRARVEHYRDGMIVLTEHKEDDRVEERVIHLPPALRAEVEGLIGSRAEGPIWRNAHGNPWTPNALHHRFRRARIRLELGEGVFPYALRGKFASDAINRSDANPAVVAKILGHANMDMLLKHYFRENPEAVQKALEEIRRAKEEGEGG